MDKKKSKPGTYPYFAEKLGIAVITAKKYGKDKCKKLLYDKGISIAAEVVEDARRKNPVAAGAVTKALDALLDSKVMSIVELDAQSRQLGSELLYDSLKKLKELKDSKELSVYHQIQVNLSVAKLIAGGK